jgi:hypothetical protein
MTVTMTLISGPTVIPGKGVEYTWSCLLDDSFAAGGEPLADVYNKLGYVYGGRVEGADAIADCTWRYDVVGPGRAVAASAANILLVAHHSSGADAVDNPADAENLSTVGALIVTVWGKDAIQSSWS